MTGVDLELVGDITNRNDCVAQLIRDLAQIGERHGRCRWRKVKGKITISFQQMIGEAGRRWMLLEL